MQILPGSSDNGLLINVTWRFCNTGVGGQERRRCGDRGDAWSHDDRAVTRQPPKSLLRMPPPLAQTTSATPISEPPATTPDATGKVNSLASSGLRLSIRSATRAPRKNKSP